MSRSELLFTGRRLDPETGLQLNRNRFYHQQLGRWVNRDPRAYRLPERNPSFDERVMILRKENSGSPIIERIIHKLENDVEKRLRFMEDLVPTDFLDVTRPYSDGMSLYGAYFVPNGLDPSGEKIICGGVGGFLGWIFAFSGSVTACADSCGNVSVVVCGGAGVGAGGGGGFGGSAGSGCLNGDRPGEPRRPNRPRCSGWQSPRIHLQGNLGNVGVDLTIDNGVQFGPEFGVGGGAAATLEACYAF